MKLSRILSLVEAAVDPSQKLSYDTPDSTTDLKIQLVEAFEQNCSDAMYMVEHNVPFYRGTKNDRVRTFAIIDPTQTERRSQSGADGNFYTLFLDNHPDRADWPKRKNSTIATTDHEFVENFGPHTLVVIPFNDVKIGSTGTHDIWDNSIKWPFHTPYGTSLPDVNNMWARFVNDVITPASQHTPGLPVPTDNDWNSWNELHVALQKKTAREWATTDGAFDPAAHSGKFRIFLETILTDGLLPTIRHMYSNDNLRPTQTTFTTSAEFVEVKGEVWVGGKSLVMTKAAWRLLRRHYGFD